MSLDLNQARIMGILNVTPDSFSDGGHFLDPQAAVERALQIQEEGADLLDIGAESSRPGSQPVGEDDERRRLEPVLVGIQGKLNIPVSVDTRHGKVAQWALGANVEVINDISGGQDPRLLEAVISSGAGYILMHMRGVPQNMMEQAQYRDVLGEIANELAEALKKVEKQGLSREKICIDPGFGFAKTPAQNYRLLEGLADLIQLGCPLLVGLSRKRMIRELVGEAPAALQAASITSALLAYEQGARIFRVHDVAETLGALKTFQTLTKEGR